MNKNMNKNMKLNPTATSFYPTGLNPNAIPFYPKGISWWVSYNSLYPVPPAPSPSPSLEQIVSFAEAELDFYFFNQ